MLFKFVIFFVFGSMLITVTVTAQTDYCTIQEGDCGGIDHIGCAKNYENSSKNWINFVPIDINDFDKSVILHYLNELKNAYANGTYADKGYETAAAFELIEWNKEFEYLSNLTVRNLDLTDEVCTLTDDSDGTYTLAYEDKTNTTTIVVFLAEALEKFIGGIREQNREWFSSYFSETKRLGCAIAEYTIPNVPTEENVVEDTSTGDNSTDVAVKMMRCILDTIADNRFNYNTGVPCTECKTKLCTIKYNALCEPYIQ